MKNVEKIDVPKIDQGCFRDYPGVIRDFLEWFLMIFHASKCNLVIIEDLRILAGGECFAPLSLSQRECPKFLSGQIAGNIKAKPYMRLGWFFINISGLVNSFGLASCVAQGIINLLHWIATGPSGKSIRERARCRTRIFHDDDF